MGFLQRAFGKKKQTYESRTYVGTPGGFQERRSPSDMVVVSHPSLADYQAHLNYIDHKARREQALSYLSEHSDSECYSSSGSCSEDLFEDQSEDSSDSSSQVYNIYSDEEEDEEPIPVNEGASYRSNATLLQAFSNPQQHHHISSVNRTTAQEQWARLQNHAVHRQQNLKALKPAPVYHQPQQAFRGPVYQPSPAPQPTYHTPIQRQTPPSQQHSVRRPALQRVSYLSTIRGHRYSEPAHYQPPTATAPRQRCHSNPNTHPSAIDAAAQLAARSVTGGERSYHEKQTDYIRKKAGIAPFPYRMIGGLPIPGAWVE